jgi:hypothetical protein
LYFKKSFETDSPKEVSFLFNKSENEKNRKNLDLQKTVLRIKTVIIIMGEKKHLTRTIEANAFVVKNELYTYYIPM